MSESLLISEKELAFVRGNDTSTSNSAQDAKNYNLQ